MNSRNYTEVTVGETVFAHGIPFEVTTGPVTYRNDSVVGGESVYFIGTYRGPDMDSDNPLYPFVKYTGDTWTFQRAIPYALLWEDEEGNWHQDN